MDNSDNNPSIKIVSTCQSCGEALDTSDLSIDTSVCSKCRSKGKSNPASASSTTDSGRDPDVPAIYDVLERLSECQHGKAFVVRDTTLDKKLLIRFVTVGVARLTGGLPIETVAQLLVQQTHPHVATVYDWRTEGKNSYFVLDAPDTRSLETIIQSEGFLDLPRAIDIFIQVCEALELLHKLNVVHGYLRPRALGIVESPNKVDTVKVTNFSITNVFANNIDQPLKVSRNYTCNDVFYMSPEELRGNVPSIPADIYSLGCVFFHSITGKPVYRARTVQEVKDMHLDPAPARFRRRYEIPPHVEAIILRMLEHEPSKRYKTVRAIRCDLERISNKKPPLLEDRWKTALSWLGQ